MGKLFEWPLPEGGDETGELAWRQVQEVFEHAGVPYDLYAEAADGVQVHFGVTGEHPFWVGGRGWVEVQDIRPEDRLWSLERGWLWVRSVHERRAQEPVYNLRVAEDRTYFVGESAVWVHNKGPSGGPKVGNAGGPGAGKRIAEGTKDAAEAQAGGKCVFCERETTRTPGGTQRNTDHAIPKSRGGNNTLDNAQNTCRDCNLDKGTQTTQEYLFRLRQGGGG